MALTVDGCISSLIGMGYEFRLKDDGSASVRQPAKRNPLAAEMMNYLALHKEEVRAAVRARQAVQMQLPVDPVADGALENQRVIKETLDKPGAADQIRAADGTGEVHELVGMNSEEASSLIEFIREGKGELIGQFVYHKSTGRFDATIRFLEGWDS